MDGVEHGVIVIRPAIGFGQIVETLGSGFGIFRMERREIAGGTGVIAAQIECRADAGLRFIAIRSCELGREDGVFLAGPHILSSR